MFPRNCNYTFLAKYFIKRFTKKTELLRFESYQIMLKCWSANPDDRPTFHQLRCSLEDFEAHHENYVDFNCSTSSPAHTLPPTEEEIAVV